MTYLLSLPVVGLYGAALVGQVMLSKEKINIFQGKIEVPLEIMYKFQLKTIFPSHFVPFISNMINEEIHKPYRLNRKTRPPNIRMAL